MSNPLLPIVDNEDTWIQGPHFSASSSLHIGLRAIEETLRCPICKSFHRHPVSVQPCQHTFCSECIRCCFRKDLNGMKRSACCPVCRAPVDTTGVEFAKCLKPNRSVEILTNTFQGIREDLKASLVAAKRPRNASPPRASTEELNEADTNQSSAPACTRSHSREAMCPVVQLKKKARPYYNGLKKSQLQDLCRSEGLSTAGSERDLKTRHSSFLDFYNAECDSSNPRSQEELVKEFYERERARNDEHRKDQRNGAATQSAFVEQQFRKRNGMPTSSNLLTCLSDDEFRKSWNEGFKKLIEEGRARKAAEKKRAAGVDLSEPRSSIASGHSQTSTSVTDVCDVRKTMNDAATHDSVTMPLLPPEKQPAVEHVRVESSPGNVLSNIASSENNQAFSSDTLLDSVNSTHCSGSVDSSAGSGSIMTCDVEDFVARSSQEKASHPLQEGLKTLNTKKRKRQRTLFSAPNTRSGGLTGPWRCSRCTYENDTRIWSNAKCQMCNGPRQLAQPQSEYVVIE